MYNVDQKSKAWKNIEYDDMTRDENWQVQKPIISLFYLKFYI